MSWEKRGNNFYYYSKTRSRASNAIESTYWGSSTNETAITMAELDLGRWLERRIAKAEAQSKQELYKAFNQEIAQIDKFIKTLTNATLLVNGYHFHKGSLRKLRKSIRGKENELTCIVSKK